MTWNDIAAKITSMTAEQRSLPAVSFDEEIGEFYEITEILPAEKYSESAPPNYFVLGGEVAVEELIFSTDEDDVD